MIFAVLLSQGKSATQSNGDYAERAVDGDTNQTSAGGSCMDTSTNVTKTLAWWIVDLNDTYRIGNITIWNRDEYENNIGIFHFLSLFR